MVRMNLNRKHQLLAALAGRASIAEVRLVLFCATCGVCLRSRRSSADSCTSPTRFVAASAVFFNNLLAPRTACTNVFERAGHGFPRY
jgi:hypothetical protein